MKRNEINWCRAQKDLIEKQDGMDPEHKSF